MRFSGSRSLRGNIYNEFLCRMKQFVLLKQIESSNTMKIFVEHNCSKFNSKFNAKPYLGLIVFLTVWKILTKGKSDENQLKVSILLAQGKAFEKIYNKSVFSVNWNLLYAIFRSCRQKSLTWVVCGADINPKIHKTREMGKQRKR